MIDEFDDDVPDLPDSPLEPASRPLTPEAAATLAGALVRLRRETFAQIEQATQVRPPNLSAWLKGKPQVINAQRAARLLDHLGVRNGALRTDVVHRWTVVGTVKELEAVLDQLLTIEERDGLRIIREHGADLPWALVVLPTPSGRAFALVKEEADLNGTPVVSPAAFGYGEAAWTGESLKTLVAATQDEVAAVADGALSELDLHLGVALAERRSVRALANAVGAQDDVAYAAVMAAVAAALERGAAPEAIIDAVQRLAAQAKR